MKIILDSNIFDDLVAGQLELDFVENLNAEIFITHIQVDELNNCPDHEKRAKLFLHLTEVRPQKLATESFVVGTSRLGSAKLGDGEILEKLRNGNLKKTNDALIGETAIKNGLTLITNDKELKRNVNKLGGKALTIKEFLEIN